MSYSSSKAQAGRGSSLSIGPAVGATGTSFVVIGEIKQSNITGAQWAQVDVTNFQSGVDQEFITTIRTPGELDIQGNRVSSDAGQVAIEAAYQSGALFQFKLQLLMAAGQTTLGDAAAFNALVISREFSVDVTKEITFQVKLKISGPVVWTIGS